jgi:lipid A 3-O-deacylase
MRKTIIVVAAALSSALAHAQAPEDSAPALLPDGTNLDCVTNVASEIATGGIVSTPSEECGVLTILLENDFFAFDGGDKNYTTGTKVILRPRRKDGKPAEWVWDFGTKWLGARGDDNVFESYGFGQNIYTPENTKTALPLPKEHPYAGWLYGEFAVHAEDIEKIEVKGQGPQAFPRGLTSATLTLGVVGPHAFAEDIQDWVHEKLLGQGGADGWDNQLKDEPGVILTLEKRRRWRLTAGQWWEDSWLGTVEGDLIGQAGVSVGNVLTEAQVGFNVRFGGKFGSGNPEPQLAESWGPVRVRPGNVNPGEASRRMTAHWQVWGGLIGRASAQNIFLDGNTWRDSLSVDKETFVGDLELGAAINAQFAVFSYTYVLRSEEFKNQSGPQDFGAISMSVEF